MHIAQVVVPEQLALANQTTERQLAGETAAALRAGDPD